MKRILCSLVTPLAAALLLAPAAASASSVNFGSVACSGVLDIGTVGSVDLSCEGNLSLSDSVISDPMQILIEASGTLTITRSQIKAPIVWLAAELIELDDSVVFSSAYDDQEPGILPFPLLPDGRELENPQVIGIGHGQLVIGGDLTVGGSSPPRSQQPLPPSGGSLALNGGSITLSGGSGGTPPVSLIPEPSAALLLAAGLGVIMLRRKMKTGSR